MPSIHRLAHWNTVLASISRCMVMAPPWDIAPAHSLPSVLQPLSLQAPVDHFRVFGLSGEVQNVVPVFAAVLASLPAMAGSPEVLYS